MSTTPCRVGLIGFGFIGRAIHAAIEADGVRLGLATAFVHARNGAPPGVPTAQVCADLGSVEKFHPDLIVEVAHPAITLAHGAAFLRHSDYMPLSLTALAVSGMQDRLLAAAAAGGRRLLVASGALVGVDSLLAGQADWSRVRIIFRKHPRNIDFSDTDIDPAAITAATTLYDGPVRGIAPLFPRNVNTMVACALATVGLDQCEACLVADPTLDVAIAEIAADGRSGAKLRMEKRVPAVGVSGTEMVASVLHSILRSGAARPGLDFC